MATKKTKSAFSSETIKREINTRFNPLPGLTPELVTAHHTAFDGGRLGSAARLWEQMEQSDDMIKVVAPKRKKAVSRLGFEIITVDDSAEAKKHAKTLEDFYTNLVATNALDLNERGGLPLLIRQMMDSVSKKYAVHEIVWIPGTPFTAEFRFAPLWFFENTTGRLRFLQNTYAVDGVDLEPGGWMVTTGDGLMRACAIAWVYKHLPLQDWLIYSERFGMPAIKGTSTGRPGDESWNAMEAAVTDLAGGEAVVVSQGSDITAIDLGKAGNLPYPPLVERMDRAIASLYRGGDLSSMSKGDGVGASVQDDETELLENDDAANITDVLNEQVDKWVIRYVHGSTTPKAWIRIKENIRQDVVQDLATDKGLLELGYTDPLEELAKRYNRPHLARRAAGLVPAAREGLVPATTAANALKPKASSLKPPIDVLVDAARAGIAAATAADLLPIATRLDDLLQLPDDQLAAALKKFQTEELPELAAAMLADPTAAAAFEQSIAEAMAEGMRGEA